MMIRPPLVALFTRCPRQLFALALAATFVLLELAPASADPCPGSDTCPTQQYAVAGGATEVTINWVEPDTGPDDATLSGFIVSRSQSGSSFSPIGRASTVPSGDPNVYNDYTVQPNTSYVYQICGLYSSGDQSCVTTNTVTTPPAASNTATPPPTITQASATASSITFSWNGNTTYQFYQVSYVLLSELGIGRPSQSQVAGGTSGSATFSLQPSTGYQVAVQGCQPGWPSSNCSKWTTKNIWTKAPAAPAPLEPPTPRTQAQGGDINVGWGNPTGVWTASVTRTPAWLAGSPSAMSTVWVCANGSQTPCLAAFDFMDEMALAGQVYTYTVCLYYKSGNYESDDACGSTTGEWPMPTAGNGTGGMITQILHLPLHLVAVNSANAVAQLGKQGALFHLPSHLVAVDSANALARLGKQTSAASVTNTRALPKPLGTRTATFGKQISSGSCKPGLVLREAYAGDQVCVTPQVHAQASADNRAAARRQVPSGRCIAGYVWRQADPRDHVCVTPQTRAQVTKDNAAPTDR
jgi:hypothetical protein